LFEPLVLLALVVLLRVLALGRAALPSGRAGWIGLGAFLGVCGLAVLWDGFRAGGLPPEARAAFPRWAASIGELQPAGLGGLFAWAGWLGPFAGAALLFSRRRGLVAGGLLVCALGVLAFSMARWGPFFVLGVVAILPSALGLFPKAAVARLVLLVSLWPVARVWDERLFPSPGEAEAILQRRIEGPLLREASANLPAGSIFIAPWWVSPAVAYWSGARGVSGSSHQSLEGTLKTAEFFLTEDAARASAILRESGARFVVVDDPERTLPNSSALLNQPASERSVGRLLWSGRLLEGFERVGANPFFKIYEAAPLPAEAPGE
ncbi:MAG: hypothetical protein N2322_07480, partial [Terrimicrobiaceae bacterium]|nr:hypothetical protein [Terrimicrobiaceae bacterium]